VGRRQRQREKLAGHDRQSRPAATLDEYRDADGNVLVLRGSLTAATRREYAEVLAGGTDREDAWQRATELLFERLATSWTIAGLELTSQKELLGRFRMATGEERSFVRDALRAHAREHFRELEAP
jgi:hypothetical protein